MRSSFAGLKAVALLASLAVVLVGCPGGHRGGGGLPLPIDNGQSKVTVDRTTGIRPDGQDKVTITVTVIDTGGNPVANANVTITVSGGGTSLANPNQATAANGVVTTTLTSTTPGNKTITAVATQNGSTTPVTILQQPVVTFGQTVSPSSSFVLNSASTATANGSGTISFSVTIVDTSGKPIPNAQVTFNTTGSGNTITGTVTTNAQGVASGTIASTRAEVKTLSVVANGVTLTTQINVTFLPGPATQIAFIAQPMSVTAGASIVCQVAIEDAFGNIATTNTNSVSVAIGNNPGNATLGGTTPVVASGGVATFSNLTIQKSGVGYTLVASATGFANATSAPFNISAGPATQLVFSSPPSNVNVSTDMVPDVAATAQDQFGNTATSFTGNVTLAIGAGPGGAALATTTNPVAATAGIATFTHVQLNKASPPSYTLTATASGVTGATSGTFNVSGAGIPAGLKFTLQPATSQSQANFSVSVQVVDTGGNAVNAATNQITIAIATGSPGGTLSGGTIVNANGLNGTASFTNSIDKAGTGYKLLATSPGLTSATSTAFDITPGNPAQLFWSQQPQNAAPVTTLTPAPAVTVQDAAGNTVTSFNGPVTLALSAGGTLAGTNPVNAAAGIATFSNLSINNPGTYTLTAQIAGPITKASNSFTISGAGIAAKLKFTSQPTSSAAGAAIPNFTVALLDVNNNPVNTSGVQVTLGFQNNPGGSTITGANPVSTVAGVATFSGISLNKTGIGYVFTATATGLTTGTSAAFDITPGPATQLAFLVGPSGASAGTTIAPAIQVAVEDANQNVVTSSNAAITLAVASGGPATILGTNPVNASSGVATFNINFQKAGTYTLTASTNGLPTSAPTAAFAIAPGPATTYSLSGLANPSTAGVAQGVTVTALDVYANTAVAYVGTAHFTSTDPKAVLPPDYNFVPGDKGAHTFAAGVTLKTSGSRTVTATDKVTGTITGSQTVTVNPAGASSLIVSGLPGAIVAGTASNLSVTAYDPFLNVATGYLGTVHFTSTDGQAALPADYTFVGGDNGAHTFANGVTLKTSGSQSVTATDTVVNTITGTDGPVTVNPAAAKTLSVVMASPQSAGVAGAVTVTARDPFANVATGYLGTVHFTSSDPAAVLPADYTFVGGDAGTKGFTATFKTAGAQSITATDTVTATITGAQGGITVKPAAASKLQVFAILNPYPAGVKSDVMVTALDPFNNTASGYAGTIHFTKTDPGAQSAVPADYTFGIADAGSHTFTGGVTLVTLGSQTVTATDTITATITGAQTVTVNPGPAVSFLVTGIPLSIAAGTQSDVTVTAKDQFGNTTPYTKTVHFTSSDGQAVLPANYTFTALDAGVHTFTKGVTLKTAGTQSVTATDTVTLTITGTENGITVTPLAANTFQVTNFPSPQQAGVAGVVSVTAVDQFGNTATSYTGTVRFTSSDGTAVLPANYTFLFTDKGTKNFPVTLKTAGTQSITATDTVVNTITGTQSGIVVQPAPASTLVVNGITNPVTAGTASNVTVTARDPFGNTATSYTGQIHFTSTDPFPAVLPPDYTFGVADAGSHTFAGGVTLKTAGTQSVKATDNGAPSINGTQNGIVVNPAGASKLTVVGIPTPITAGTASDVKVTALDPFNNTAMGYTGTVHFTSTDPFPAVLPLDYTFNVADAGSHTFTGGVTLKTAGTQSVTATDKNTPSITGAETNITVNPGAAMTLTVNGITTPLTAGNTSDVKVTARDQFGNVATSYGGTIHFTKTDSGAQSSVPANYIFNAIADNGSHTFTGGVKLVTAGLQSVTATDTNTPSITGTQSNIAVVAAGASSIALNVASSLNVGVAADMKVTAFDQFGNVATSYAQKVTFSSSDLQAVFSPATYQFAIADAGSHTFTGGATLKTAGTQSITVTDNTGGTPLTVTVNNISVAPGPINKFLVVVKGPSVQAGNATDFTVTAQDQFSNTIPSYAGTINISTTDAKAILSQTMYTFSAVADMGSHTFTNGVTFKTVGSGTQSVSVTDGASHNGSGTVSVTPGPLSQFLVVAGTNPVQAGTASDLTFTAQDQFQNTVTGYTGQADFSTTDPKGTFTQPSYTFAPVDNGKKTLVGLVTLKTTPQQTVTVADHVTPALKGSIVVTVTPQPAVSLVVTSSSPTPFTAGQAAQLTVSARDSIGNVDSNYRGTIKFTSTDNGAQTKLPLPPSNQYTFTAVDAGLHDFGPSAVTLTTAAPIQTVTATDTLKPSITGGLGVQVVAAALNGFQVAVPPTITAGTPLTATITAQDQFLNTVTGYTGTISFSSTNDSPRFPPSYTFVLADNGTRTFPGTLTGTVTVGASPTVTGSGTKFTTELVVGEQIIFGSQPGVLYTVLSITDNLTFTLTAPYSGTPTVGTQVFGGVTMFKAGAAQNITVTGSSKTGAANLQVFSGPVSQLSVSGIANPTTAATANNFTVQSLDAFGNLNQGYTGKIHFTSTDAKASVPADYTFTTGLGNDNGVHNFTAGTGGQVTFKSAPVNPTPQTLTATDTIASSISGSQTVNVVPGPPAFVVTSSIANVNSYAAGTTTDLIVSVQDSAGNVQTGYTGTVHFVISDGQAPPIANYTFTVGDAGQHTFTGALTLKTANAQTVTVSNVGGPPPSNGVIAFTVKPGPAVAYTVTGLANNQPAGTGLTYTVTAIDQFGNTATGYTGTANFSTPSDPSSVLNPPSYAFQPVDGGLKQFPGGVTFKTTGLQKLQANDGISPVISGFQTVNVNPAATKNLVLTGVANAQAGTNQTLTVTAKDTLGNTATNYAGTINFTSTDAQFFVQGGVSYTFSGTDNGVHTFTVRFRTAGVNQTATATDQGTPSITGTTAPVTISPGNAAQYSLQNIASPLPSGTPATFKLTALDQFGNVATSYSGTVVLSSTDGAATLAPNNYAFNPPADVGSHTFSVTFKTAGTQTVKATDQGSGFFATSNSVTVLAGSTVAFQVTPATGTTVAGVSTNVTVTPLDNNNNVVTNYNKTVHFTSTDPQAVLPADYTFTIADAGSHTFAVTLKTAGSRKVTVNELGQPAIFGSATYTVNAGPLSKLAVAIGSPEAAGISTDVTVAGTDNFGNPVPSYSRTVTFSANDPNANLPAPYTFVPLDNGTHTFVKGVTLKKAQVTTLTVSDGVFAPVNVNIVVNPGPASQIAFVGTPSNTAPNATMRPAITVQLLDAGGNLVTNNNDDISLTIGNNPGGGTLTGGTPVKNTGITGQATFSGLSINNTGNGYTLRALSNKLGLTGNFVSAPFNISGPGVAAALSFTCQPATYTAQKLMRPPTVTVCVVDTVGNVVTQFIPNGSYSLALLNNPTSATLSGNTQFGFANGGFTSYENISIDKPGSGYTLQATFQVFGPPGSVGLNPVTSNPFAVVATPVPGPNWLQVSKSPNFVGGSINGFTVDTGAATVYAATDAGIWKSPTAAPGWSEIDAIVSDTRFDSIAVDANAAGNPKPVYVTDQANVWKSIDGGVTWTQLNPANVFVNAFRVDPLIANKLYALTGNQIAISTDGGATFSQKPSTGLPNFSFGQALAIDKNGAILAGFQGAGVFRSTDGGNTFSAINGAGLTDMNIQTFAIDNNATPVAIYVGTQNGGVFFSTNTGTNWTAINTGIMFGGQPPSVAALVIDPSTTTPFATLYCGARKSGGGGGPGSQGLFRAFQNSGASWTNISNGLPLFVGEVAGLLLDPANSKKLWVGLRSAGTWVTADATVVNPVYASFNTGMPNEGVHFICVDPKNSANIFVAADNRVLISHDGGGTWVLPTTPPGPNLQLAAGIVADGAGNIYMGSEQNIFKSTDNGNNWANFSTGIPAANNFSVLPAIDLNSPLVLYVGQFASNGNIYKTTNGAGSWSTLAPGANGIATNAAILNIVVDLAGPKSGLGHSLNLYAVAQIGNGGAIYKSTNEGVSWTDTGFNNPNTDFNTPLAIDATPGGGSVYFVDKNTGVWKLTGGVGLWQKINNGLPFAVTGRGLTWASGGGANATLYLATDLNNNNFNNPGPQGPFGVWKTTNGGASWLPDTNGIFPAQGGGAIAADTNTPTTVYYGEEGTGLYKTQLGAAFQLAFGQQPTGTATNTNIAPAVTVLVQDQGGNTLNVGAPNVSVAIGNDPAGGTTLLGGGAVPPAAGVATFAGLQLNQSGVGFTLVANGAGLVSGTSNAFNVFGPADHTAFVTQPSSTHVSSNMVPDVQVAIMDASGNIITSGADSTRNVTLSFASGPVGAHMNGVPTLTVAAVNGIATFTNVAYDTPGSNYTLKATGVSVPNTATSQQFVIFGNASQLVFQTPPPPSYAAGIPFNIVVAVEDNQGNLVANSNVTINLALTSGPGPLNGTTSQNAQNGLATFKNLSINTLANNYIMQATSGLLTPATSGTFSIVPGAPFKLVFSQQPSASVTAGASLGSVKVQLQDSFGNVCVNSNATVFMALSPGSPATQLGGTVKVNAVTGVATFSDLNVLTPGSNDALLASLTPYTAPTQFNPNPAPPLRPVTSSSFNVTGGNSAVKLAFIVQPGTTDTVTALNTPGPGVQVALVDAAGNLVAGASATITLQAGNGTPTLSAASTLTHATSGGIAKWTDLMVSNTGTFTILATAPGFPPAQSQRFQVVSPGGAVGLKFVAQPTNTTAGNTINSPGGVTVQVVNAAGGAVAAATQVSLASTGSFNGPSNQPTNPSGLATFLIQPTTAGGSITLTASSPGLNPATSNAFAVAANTTPANAQLRFVPTPGFLFGSITPRQPNQSFIEPISAAYTDQFGNILTGAGLNPITVKLQNFGGLAQLNGTTVVTPSGVTGLATFSPLSINLPGNYSLQASGNYNGTPLNSFQNFPSQGSIFIGNVGSDALLAFGPLTAEAAPVNAAFPSAVQVAVQDVYGNVIPIATDTVTVQLGFNPNGAVLNGPTTATPSSGTATFNGLSINVSGNYNLSANATSGGFPSGFSINQFQAEIDAWLAANASMDGGAIFALATDPNVSGTVYASTSTNGLWKTTNAGGLWTYVPGQSPNFSSTPGFLPGTQNTGVMAIDSASSVYLALANPAGGFNGQPTQSVFKSTDGGNSWYAVGGSANGLTDSNGTTSNGPRFQSIAFERTVQSALYLGGSDSQQQAALYVSTNGGVDWIDLSPGLQSSFSFTNDNVTAIAASGNTIVVGTNNHGIWRSTNGGATWAKDTGYTGGMVTAISFDTNGTALYASTPNGGPNTVFQGSIAAATWSGVGSLFVPMSSVVGDPQVSGSIYAGSTTCDFYHWNGASWTQINTGLPPHTPSSGQMQLRWLTVDKSLTTIYGSPTANPFGGQGAGRGVFAFSTGIQQWAAATTGLKAVGIGAMAIDPNNNMNVVAAGGDRIYKSTDGGSTWAVTDLANAFGSTIQAVGYDPNVNGRVFALLGNGLGSVYVSANGGTSFTGATNLPAGTSQAAGLAFDTSTFPGQSLVYVGTDKGILTTPDGGTTWNTPSNTGLPTLNSLYKALVIDPTTGGVTAKLYAGNDNIFGGSGQGVFATSNAAGSWAAINGFPAPMLNNTSIAILVLDGTQTLFAAAPPFGFGGGAFKTVDGGNTWNPLNFGFGPQSPSALVKDPTTTGASAVLFAAVGGIDKSTNGGNTWNGAGGGITGQTNALAIVPTATNTVYAGTGAGVYKTTTGGQ